LSSSALDTAPRIILRIPGPWESLNELAVALRDINLGFTLAIDHEPQKATLINSETHQHFNVWQMERDDEIASIFADRGRISGEDVEAIDRHRAKFFVEGPGGSLTAARAMLAAGAAIISAGGLGVMVDNNANTHSPKDWLDLAGDPMLGGMYWAFVNLTGNRDEVFSTGMHCLGFRDAILPNPPSKKVAADVLHNFLGYSYQSGATIIDGEALGGPDGPEFIVRHELCTCFRAGTPFHNPYGIWRLEKYVEEDK